MNRITYIDTNYGQINRNNVSFKANRRTYEQDVNDVSMGCYTGLFRGDINWRRLGAYILSHFNNKDKVKSLDYYTRYSAHIIGKRDNDSIIIVDKIWIEGILIESKNSKIGDKVSVRAISLGEIPEFSGD